MKSTSITIGEKTIEVESLPPEIKQFLAIYSAWEDELSAAKVEVFKLEAAIKGLSQEIEIRLKSIEDTL